MGEVKLTTAQHWALQAIARGQDTSPAWLGQKMMERPGAVPEHRRGMRYKAQGYGRMGGAMMSRLEKMGLVRYVFQRNSFTTHVVITPAGRAALQQQEADHGPAAKGEE